MKIALFPGCMVDMIYPETGIAAVNVLERLGCEISLPDKQVCCGQGLVNSGYADGTRSVAKNTINAYDACKEDFIVSLTGSCMNAIVNDYPPLFEDDPVFSAKLRSVTSRFREFTQFIVDELGVTDVGASFPHTVTFHKSCHSTRLLGIKEQPLKLLDNVAGLQYIEMEHADRCCGFGGTFSFKEPEISGEMVREKCRTIIESGAEVVTGVDSPCLMNIKGALSRMRSTGELDRDIRVMHIARILDAKE